MEYCSYSLANEVFVDVMKRYDNSQSFDAFLYSCLLNKIKTEMTKRNREKRKADRKTYGSILLDNHIDNRLIMEQMGHTDILCTENHYHRNRKSADLKSQILSSIPEFKTN